MPVRRAGWARRLGLRLALLGVGVSAVAWLVHEAGTDAVQRHLGTALEVLPLLLILEGARIGCEAVATRGLTGERSGKLPWLALLRAQLACYSVCIVAPAGRTAGEAVKGTMLAPYIGGGRAAVIAATLQALTLFANGALALAATILAVATLDAPFLVWALAAYVAITWGGALSIQAVTRSRRLGRWVAARFAKLRRPVARFRKAASETARFPALPATAVLAGRLLQALQFGALAGAMGLGFDFRSTLLGQGVNLVSAGVGDLVPAQLGIIDGAFALAAGSLGTTAAVGVSIAVLIHCVQLTWVVLGAAVPTLLPAPKTPPTRRAPAQRHPLLRATAPEP